MINFGSGPAAIPLAVKQKIQESILVHQDTGLSILELPHRGEVIQNIITKAGQLVRELLELPDDYHVLWMPGGGRLQFHMLPLNFLNPTQQAGYVISGHWAQQAYLEGVREGKTQILATSEAINFAALPYWSVQTTDKNKIENLSYIHYCSNNTLYGTQFQQFTKIPGVPLVVDMSSDLFTRDLDFTQFDMIYAVAQKNLGAAGVTLVIIKDDFLERAQSHMPDILSYKSFARSNSTVNTPPVFSIFASLCMLEWIREQSTKALYQKNSEKAQLLYSYLETSQIFELIASKGSRSDTNVCFRLVSRSLHETDEVIAFAAAHGITGIKGHRFIGGFRVALYNAITKDDVEKLIAVLSLYETEKS